MVGLVVAVGQNGEIGKGLNLLWRLPNDMLHFKVLTTGNTVVMGRRTWESLPKGALPNRKNIVVSSRERDELVRMTDDVLVCSSIDEALASERMGDLYFIGGKSIYENGLRYADCLFITYVEASFQEADVFFPTVDFARWREVNRTDYEADEKHIYNFSIVEYERI